MSKDSNENNKKYIGKGWEFSFFETESPQAYVEAWFDNHPEPWNIDGKTYHFGDHEIEVFFADQVFNCWMIKITCNNSRRATYLSQLFYKMTCQMDITQILIGKKLFLFQDLRF
jgi:hypothetical protein